MSVQDLILNLHSSGPRQGCYLAQTYDLEVGRRDHDPGHLLPRPRTAGPGRLATSSHRGGRRTAATARTRTGSRSTSSIQVIMKPSPDDIQDDLCPEPRVAGDRPRGPRPPIRRGRLGIADNRRLGRRLAGHARRAGDHPVHLLPAVRRDRRFRPSPSRSPTASSGSRCSSSRRTIFTTLTGRPTSPTATFASDEEREFSEYNFDRRRCRHPPSRLPGLGEGGGPPHRKRPPPSGL